MFAAEPMTWAGGVGSLIAAILGGLALWQTRRTENKTATREEVQQAFDMQDKAMSEVLETNERLTKEIARVRERNDEQHESLNRVLGQLATARAQHRTCQDDLNALGDQQRTTQAELEDTMARLHIAEAKIAELGG